MKTLDELTGYDTAAIIFDILADEYSQFFEGFEFKNDVKIKIIGEKKGLPSNIHNIFSIIEKKTNARAWINLKNINIRICI